ncbi:hypothetical protein LTR67_008623 [Exophiala xenobiotica]
MSRDASATVPLRAAGGVLAPEAGTELLLKPFSETVLSSLLSAYEKLPAEDRPRYPDESSFLTYMASDKSSAMSTSTENDLTYPMSSYFISSSHNTYLSGHQLYGEASVEAYTNVLKRGCRCLEIDVWDGDDSDTSSSDEDDEQVIGPSGHGIDRSNSKRSRWNRVKARAARMRSRSRSRSGSLADPAKVPASTAADARSLQQVPAENDAPSQQSELSAQHTKYLSPQPSPALPPRVEPRVLHGYTLTQSVTFRSVCHAIKNFAFVSTDLPLIVSLEVHASLSQQEVMVEIMKEVWSGLLVDLTHVPQDLILPSPQTLKKKILIKVKWTPNTETGESNNPLDQVNSSSTNGITDDGTVTSPEKKKKAYKVLTTLSELGVYTRAYTFKHFSQPEASIPTHVFSLSESKMHSMHADPVHGPALFDHNKKFLMRVFPKGTRINSSNVDPTFHWRQGAQMVALNWQKIDKGMMLNEGMFASTGGWVLKPEGYRCTESSSSPKSLCVLQKRRLNLEITFLAGQRIPVSLDKDVAHASKIKPYIKVQLHVDSIGPPGQGKNAETHPTSQAQTITYGPDQADQDVYKWTSSTHRTDSPDFGGERLTWQNVPDVVDELSFLRYVAFFVWLWHLPFWLDCFPCNSAKRATKLYALLTWVL